MRRWCLSKLPCVAILMICCSLPLIEGSCVVTSKRCEFPFSHEGEEHNSCIKLDDSEDFVCKIGSQEERFHWGVCNDGCQTNDADLQELGGEMSLSAFCKSLESACVFPFIYEGVSYDSCTTHFSHDGQAWCATQVDLDGVMVPGRWGTCNTKKCPIPQVTDAAEAPNPDSLEQEATPKVAVATFDGSFGVTGEVRFEQTGPEEAILVKGNLSGLVTGQHGLHVHTNSDVDNECRNTGPHFNPFNTSHGDRDTEVRHVGDLGNMEVDEEGRATFSYVLPPGSLSLFDGPKQILQRALVIHKGQDDLGKKSEIDPESALTGSSGTRIACALIVDAAAVDHTMSIIIVVVIVIVLLLMLLFCCLIWYCSNKPKSKIGEKVALEDDGLAYPNGDACKKSPLYDELSIPFIDASPAPTPKAGRSTERLSFFNRTPSIGRSRGSLSNDA